MATTYQKFLIPVDNIPQRFTVELGGRAVTIRSRWNDVAGLWFVDIYDAATTAPIVLSMPLVTGINLLRQHRHKGLEGGLVAFTEGDQWAPPTFANLGAEGRVTYAIPE